MDGRTRYNKICNLLKSHVGETKTRDQLRRIIMIEIGSSEATIQETLRLMIDLDLIKEIDHLIFKVIKDKADV